MVCARQEHRQPIFPHQTCIRRLAAGEADAPLPRQPKKPKNMVDAGRRKRNIFETPGPATPFSSIEWRHIWISGYWRRSGGNSVPALRRIEEAQGLMKLESNAPTVSVVIPLYNKRPHIARAFESVLAQNVQDFEVVVVDDASTDGGAEMVRGKDDARIRLIQQPHGGAAAARNRGIAEARSELIAFLDADDAWEPLFMKTILRLRAAFPSAGAYATAYRMRDRGDRVELKSYPGVPEAPWEGLVPDYFSSVRRTNLIWTSAVAVPKHIFSTVGGFPESAVRGEDIDMWFRIAVRYPIAFSRYVGSTWFRDSTNRLCETVDESPADPVILHTILRAMGDPSVGPELLEKLHGYHDALVAKFAKVCLIKGRPKAARRLLDGSLSGHDGGLYLLTFLPGRVLGALIAARRRLVGLS